MSTGPRSHPAVYVVTAHGRQQIDGDGDERLIDLLGRHQVPWSGVSIYVVPRSTGEPTLRPCLERTLGEMEDLSEILIYFNRNVNPFLFSPSSFKLVASADPDRQATEYLYQRYDNAQSRVDTFLKKLSPEECQSAIAARVSEAVRATVAPGSHLVVGVSGGGDSNALLHGLTSLRDHGLTVHPVIAKGIPDWDAGVPRAQKLCEKYGLDLVVMEQDEVQDLLGIPAGRTPLIDRFEREFQGDDFEFLGTLLVRLALFKHAKRVGTKYICTGLNLEDVLCEALYRISVGLKPAAFPSRTIGDMSLVLPLWLCPKRIIDGCFPKLSLENYDARYPCFSLGRNLYYSLIYSMQSQYPGFPEQLARGLSELSTKDPVVYRFDEELGFHVERFVPFPLLHKFRKMLGRSAGPMGAQAKDA